MVEDIVNLNELDQKFSIPCPYCNKEKIYVYGATGMVSSRCGLCHRLVLWDYDNGTAYKAKARKFAS